MKIYLKQIRQEKHLTLLQLSLKSKVSIAEISHIENENNIPTLEVAYRIAYALNVSVYDIFVWQKDTEDK